jgi:hypothetical protein
MLAKYVPGDIKYIFTKFYRHISPNNEANRKFLILISNPDRVKPKTIKLVFVASPLNTQH